MTSSADHVSCLAQTRARLTEELSTRGFSSVQRLDGTDVDLFRWVRDCGWKKDIVQAGQRRGAPHLMTLSVIVNLPCRAEKDLILDGRTVQWVLGKNRGYWLPTMWLKVRCGSYVRRVVADVLEALAWFDTFSSPGVALDVLESGRTNYGKGGGRAYDDVRSYLTEKAGEFD